MLLSAVLCGCGIGAPGADRASAAITATTACPKSHDSNESCEAWFASRGSTYSLPALVDSSLSGAREQVGTAPGKTCHSVYMGCHVDEAAFWAEARRQSPTVDVGVGGCDRRCPTGDDPNGQLFFFDFAAAP